VTTVRWRTPGPADRVSLDSANAVRLRTLRALGDLELDPLRLVESAVAGGVDRGVVNEHIGAAAVLGDETEALFSVEPLNSALCHGVNLFPSIAVDIRTARISVAALPSPMWGILIPGRGHPGGADVANYASTACATGVNGSTPRRTARPKDRRIDHVLGPQRGPDLTGGQRFWRGAVENRCPATLLAENPEPQVTTDG